LKILILGASGFLGSHLVPSLIRQGHHVTAITRDKQKADNLKSRGVNPIEGDLLQPDQFISRITRQDAVVSIAMPDITPGRITSKQFKELREQVTAYFGTAIAVAEKAGCPLILTLGTSFRTLKGKIADESWPIDRFGMAKAGEYADKLIAEATGRGSPPLIQMLPGEIYGPGGMFADFMYAWMKNGTFKTIGSGKNHIPRIHVEDCAAAYIHALKKMPVGERYIIADDEPCTVSEFNNYIADCLDVPHPASLPGFLIRIGAGKYIYDTVTMDCIVSNAKAKKELDWQLKYPTYREGIKATISALEKQ